MIELIIVSSVVIIFSIINIFTIINLFKLNNKNIEVLSNKMVKTNNDNTEALVNLMDKNTDNTAKIIERNNNLVTGILVQERHSADELQARLMSLVGIQHWSSNQVNRINNAKEEEDLTEYYDRGENIDGLDAYEDDKVERIPLPIDQQNPFKAMAGIVEEVDPRDIISSEEKIGGADLDELV